MKNIEQKQEREQMTNMGKSQKQDSKSRKTGRRAVLLVLSLLILGGGGWSLWKYQAWQTAIQARQDILPDEHAKEGSLYGKEKKEVEPGSFRVLVNQIPTMEEGSLDCNIAYENPSGNHYNARVSLYRKDNGKLLGNTRRVDPGNYVETIRFEKALPIGEYPVSARIELFQDETPAGDMSVDLILRVVEETSDVAVGEKESDTK